MKADKEQLEKRQLFEELIKAQAEECPVFEGKLAKGKQEFSVSRADNIPDAIEQLESLSNSLLKSGGNTKKTPTN